MGSGTRDETNRLNDQNRNDQNAQFGGFNQAQQGIGNQNQSNANQAFTGAMGNYDYLSRGFGAGDPNFSGFNGSNGGFGAAGYTANTYDPNTYTAEGYTSTSPAYQLKGIDPSNLASAKAGYDEFAKTGGMDDTAQGNFRLRGNAAIPSFYSNLKNNLATRRNIQGGYGSGFDAADDKLARTAGQATYAGNLNTEGNLQDRITAGRQFGIGGQADIGKFTNDLQLRQDVAQGGFQDAYANRQDAAGMFSAGARNQAGAFNANARNDAGQFNANARNQAGAFNAGAANSASAGNASLNERAREFNASEDSGRRTAAGSGYSGIYSDSNQAVAGANQRWLGGLVGNSGQNQNSINARYQYNQPTNWSNMIGGLGGAFGSIFNGVKKFNFGNGDPTSAGESDDPQYSYVPPKSQ